MAQGVLGDARATGDCERRGVADGGARVPEILTVSELEGFVAGVVGPELREPTEGASVVEDVEEAQELAVDGTRGADDVVARGGATRLLVWGIG